MGLTSLEALDGFIATNRVNYDAYARGLSGVPGISLARYDEHENNSHHYVVVEVDEDVVAAANDFAGDGQDREAGDGGPPAQGTVQRARGARAARQMKRALAAERRARHRRLGAARWHAERLARAGDRRRRGAGRPESDRSRRGP